jgi:ribosomal 50S subunit-recycling heat shock protein
VAHPAAFTNKHVRQRIDPILYDVKLGDVIEISFGNKSVKVKVTMIADSTKKEDAKEMFEYL